MPTIELMKLISVKFLCPESFYVEKENNAYKFGRSLVNISFDFKEYLQLSLI